MADRRGEQGVESSAALDGSLVANLLHGAWPVFLAGLPALVTLFALAFQLFPWLKPVTPPELRRVTVTDLALAERNQPLGDGRVANAVRFVVETVGYDADDIAVDWLVFEAETRERLAEQPTPKRWGEILINTRSDRVAGEIVVPPPENHTGCVFVRVLLLPSAEAAQTSVPGAARLLLDEADSPAFDPIDRANPTCPDRPSTPKPGGAEVSSEGGGE